MWTKSKKFWFMAYLIFAAWLPESRRMGFAGTLIDAMAAGVPVIASNWKYNPEIVIENVTGRIYPL